jgi:metal-responsive CopG/Arc/MetJ family transcriptional regulator
MQLSVSLADEDVQFLDRYAAEHGVNSRSAVVQQALALLRANELVEAYVDAWEEWQTSGEASAWEPTIADGIGR